MGSSHTVFTSVCFSVFVNFVFICFQIKSLKLADDLHVSPECLQGVFLHLESSLCVIVYSIGNALRFPTLFISMHYVHYKDV